MFFAVLILILISLFLILVKFNPTFWWKNTKIYDVANYKNWIFFNLVNWKMWKYALWEGETSNVFNSFLNASKYKFPNKKLESIKFDKNNFNEWNFVWFGHSTILAKLNSKNILIDPVFFQASPFFLFIKPFSYTNKPEISDLPEVIDYVLISHDHYDHLDYQTIKKIDKKVSKYLVPLWVSSHFKAFWIDLNKVEEFSWNNSVKYDEIDFSLVPSHHYSWRSYNDRNSSLWWWWIIKNLENNVYFSWDSWYFPGFKEIWEKYGPFDIAFIENWAYNESWLDIHMLPEQSVQAWLDSKSKNVMPIHWAKFNLAFTLGMTLLRGLLRLQKRIIYDIFTLKFDKFLIKITYQKINGGKNLSLI